jgi:iron complex outermembrane receptor protein
MTLSRFACATALASSIALMPSNVVAQVAPTTPDAEQVTPATLDDEGKRTSAQGGEKPDANGEILVTGSRIRRNQFNTADPVNVVSFDQAAQAGFSSTAQVLQSAAVSNGTAQINNTYGGFVTAGGPGANTLSLRGFGASRSLILLNGRRLAPSGSRGSVGSADLNVLPNIMVDRIEILNGGASSIYGSDAVAGVVNVITRANFTGILADAQINMPEIGVGKTERYGVLFGTKGERFRFTGSFEYSNRQAVAQSDVKFTRCQTSYRKADGNSAPGTGDFIDPLTGQPKCYPTGVTGEGGVTINTIATPNFNGLLVDRAPGVPAGYGALPTSAGYGAASAQVCNRFRPDSTALGAVAGFECVGGGALPLGIRDTYPRSLLANEIVNPGQQYTGFLQGSYELNALGNAEIYAELLVSRRKSEQNGNRQLSFDYPFGSPLIPANLRFATPALGAQPTNPGVPVGVRVFADYGIYNNRQKVDFVRALGGIRGEIGSSFHYDASVLRSWSDADYTSDLVLTDKLNQSLDVVASGSGFVCRNTANGCVAAPALTPAVVGGQFPASWIGFIAEPVTGKTSFRETIVSAVVDGPLFNIWGGPVQIAIGAEYRKQDLNDTPSLESQRGNVYNFTSSTITRGSDNVKEVFGEIEVPILRNRPFFEDLTLKGSARYTDYASYGSQTTYKIGGIYSPVRWLSARGSYGTSYRAPGLFEQYLGATSGFGAASGDPCNNLGAAGQNPVRVANCQSEGLSTGFVQTNSITVLQRGGADSGLKSEDSTAWTAGGVFQPSFGEWGKLSVSADYFNIKVDGGVSQLTSAAILQQCYDDPDFRAESICALIVRNSANQAVTVTTGFVNIATARVTGWDFNARYSVRRGETNFDIGGQVTRFGQRYTQLLPTDPIENNIGTLNNPRWSGVFDGGIGIDKVSFRYSVEWVGGTYSSADYVGLTDAQRATYVFEAKDYFIHSTSVRWRLSDKYQFTFGVRNLLEQKLPQISSGAYNRVGNVPLYSAYDYVGRTFFANVRAGF